jgi:hypothetical protein
MRRQVSTWMKLLSVSAVLAFGGCGITTLQLQDFAISTAIQVIASAIVNSLAGVAAGT